MCRGVTGASGVCNQRFGRFAEVADLLYGRPTGHVQKIQIGEEVVLRAEAVLERHARAGEVRDRRRPVSAQVSQSKEKKVELSEPVRVPE